MFRGHDYTSSLINLVLIKETILYKNQKSDMGVSELVSEEVLSDGINTCSYRRPLAESKYRLQRSYCSCDPATPILLEVPSPA